MNALHIGAGNIGRGFIGKLLSDSNIKVTFADVNDKVINLLAELKTYDVQIVGDSVNTIEKVNNIDAINSKDEQALINKIKQVDLITTAVGPNVLKIIASTIAKALIERINSGNNKALNIIACENMVRGTTFLKEHVFSYLDKSQQSQIENLVGFVDSAVDRIVPPIAPNDENPLLVTVEEFSEWIVDKTQFKGDIPQIAGMELTDNLMAFVERKLFTLNTGHAATAYLGKLNKIHLIKDAIHNTEIKNIVRAAMQESGEVLIRRYGFDPKLHSAYIEKILKRFANPFLIDDVDRVGREPLRKLSHNDRLIKPLLGTLEYGLENQYLRQIIATALCYKNDNDPQAVEMQLSIQSVGIKETLKKYSELNEKYDKLLDNITLQYENLSKY